ncbi:cuticle protein 65-like isoform X2 [Schistocerca piceifrons]|uniref:cuticle protein 65-like isoform X2 n=1 Tax=Schistocerca piceifrons TaxID=274613 RepID=UPI001F5FD78E|nr:cuticle protein 65-like isoform X2 [Schistocerca piceifrons]
MKFLVIVLAACVAVACSQETREKRGLLGAGVLAAPGAVLAPHVLAAPVIAAAPIVAAPAIAHAPLGVGLGLAHPLIG